MLCYTVNKGSKKLIKRPLNLLVTRKTLSSIIITSGIEGGPEEISGPVHNHWLQIIHRVLQNHKGVVSIPRTGDYSCHRLSEHKHEAMCELEVQTLKTLKYSTLINRYVQINKFVLNRKWILVWKGNWLKLQTVSCSFWNSTEDYGQHCVNSIGQVLLTGYTTGTHHLRYNLRRLSVTFEYLPYWSP